MRKTEMLLGVCVCNYSFDLLETRGREKENKRRYRGSRFLSKLKKKCRRKTGVLVSLEHIVANTLLSAPVAVIRRSKNYEPTSFRVRLPAKFKHINKRRKRNQKGFP